MKIALIGATGNAGSRILAELSRRGHHITAIARHPEKLPVLSGVTPLQADAGDVAGLAAAIKGHDAVVSSVHFTASDPHKLIAAVHQAGGPRYLVVGGAGSLEVAPGVKLIDTPQFPAIYKAEAAAGGGLPRSAAPGACAGLDLPFSFSDVRARRAHREISSRPRPVTDQRQGQQHLVRGLCDRAGR
jgi:putative NADH-flavin reductase